ncbi:phage portal protein [Halomonas sp. HMF6819]|uniref:phage portal protein n=1 Tax=Halomonas sp. HMF6819 TaxID=3373085 RepID=UPI0037A85096
MLLDSLFGQSEARESIENPGVPLTTQNLEEFFSGDMAITVNNLSAMQLAAVYSCIYVLSSSIAQLPLGVMRRQGDKIEPARDHPAYWLLHDEPNMWQTSYKWRETKQNHVLGWGNGYTQIVRSNRGELRELKCLYPWETDLVQHGSRWIYTNYGEGDAIAVQVEDMIHVRALGSSLRKGISPIRQHAQTIGLGLAAQRYGKEFFEGGGRPTGLVSVKNTLTEKSWEQLKKVWQGSVNQLRKSDNKTLMLPADLNYQSITVPPEDAQFLETRKFNRSEIAGIFNVPAHMINDLERATFSNISEQAIQFVRHTILPWVKNWEEEINRRVFTRAERAAGFYVKFNLAGLLRGTPTERAEFYNRGITDGWLDRNEVRALEDMNPREGLSEMLISVNAQPLTALERNNEQEPTS